MQHFRCYVFECLFIIVYYALMDVHMSNDTEVQN